MKLTAADIKSLTGIMEVCGIASIDDIVIDGGKVFGANESKTLILISDFAVPNLGQKAGIRNVSLLKSIFSLYKDKEVLVETEETDRDEIRQFFMKCGKSKTDFRCTSTALIKPYRKINDETAVKIKIEKAEMAECLDMLKVIAPKTVSLVVKNGVVSAQGNGSSGNTFYHEFSGRAEFVDEEETVTFHYSPQIFGSIIRAMNNSLDNYYLNVGQHGTLTVCLNGHNLTMLAIMDGDDE